MESIRKNNTLKELHLDKEALATLSLAKEGILKPIDSLMDEEVANEVCKTKKYKKQFLPFPFILAPSGKRNKEVLKNAKKDDIIKIIVSGKFSGYIKTKSVYKINIKNRIKSIFGTYDETHPGVMDTLKRLGEYSIAGRYEIDFNDIKDIKADIKKAKNSINAKTVTAIMMAAKPLHRAHERLIRLTLENTDLLIIFLLKPYKIAAKNFGCTDIILGQNHSGIGVFYNHDRINSILDTIENNGIKATIVSEFVYCDQCKTLVSTKTCPHGKHHHISYHSPSILEILKSGLLPPAVLVRKEISF